MHIAFLTCEYPPHPSGGIGISMRHLARALVAQGHRATVVMWGDGRSFNDEGVHVHSVRPTSIPKMGWLLNTVAAQRELARLIRDENVDITEAHDWTGPSAGLRLDCPVVVRCHGTDVYFGHLLNTRSRPSVRWREWLALRHAHDLVAVSAFTAEVTGRLFGLQRTIGVIPNGIDIAQFAPGRGEDETPGTLLWFGTLVRKKGVLDVCRIFNRIVEARRHSRLVLLGRDAPDRQTASPSTWALCRSLLSAEARTRVEYAGPQPYDRIQDYLGKSSICLFPSYAEAFPLSWLEAMACGKPIVAYHTPWASEVIQHAQSGMLVPLGDIGRFADVVIGLLDCPAEGHGLGRAARQRVESWFTADIVARRSVQWYQRVLNGGPA